MCVSCDLHYTTHRKKAQALQMVFLKGGAGTSKTAPTFPLSNSMDKLLEGVDGTVPPVRPPKPDTAEKKE